MEENQMIAPATPDYLSADIANLAMALSKFQGSLIQPKLEKEVKVATKSGGGYTFKYADLAGCMKAAAPGLKENGLSVVQLVSNGKLITLLLHESGQWIKSVVMLPAQSADYQAFGSALTYLKRYTYCAILGIVADADDDANYAQGNQVEFVNNPRQKSSKKNGVNLENEALAEVAAIKSKDDFDRVWIKWSNEYPEITTNGGKFWHAMIAKRTELHI